MTSTSSWTVLLLLSLSSMVSAQTCKWLHRNQQEWTRQILHNFNQMVPAEETGQPCQDNSPHLPVIDSLYSITQAESAAIAVHEVANQIVQFYRRNQDRMDYHLPAWEKLQELLNYQEQHLSDCIPEGAENQLFIQGISQRFNTLQRILEEQKDTACAWRTVHTEIGRNLRLAAQLSARMRNQKSHD
uniref:Type I interferon n=1 Tax=Nanorana parkeri TaxID=125878 RepID=A0A3G1QSP8_9NEOB|nr:type I interferon [Nanorana parkeri]